MDLQVAAAVFAQERDAFAADADDAAALGAGGDFQGDLFAVEGGNGELVAERGLGDVDGHLEQQVVALALEEAVRLDVQHDVQMAGYAAARGGLALAVQPQLDAFVGAWPGRRPGPSVLARTTPWPWHSTHGSAMIWPSPLHRSHSVTLTN